jgi:hypothetical protein
VHVSRLSEPVNRYLDGGQPRFPTRINSKWERTFLQDCTYLLSLSARKWRWLQGESKRSNHDNLVSINYAIDEFVLVA